MSGFLKRAAVLSLLCGGVLHATSQFRSPLSLEWGVMHYPLRDVDQTWWIDEVDPDCCRDTLWNVYAWAGYYHRSASKSFYNPCSPCSNTRKKTTLSQLFFGQTSFRGEQVFEGGILDCTDLTGGNVGLDAAFINNPFLRFAQITPDFDYNESGAVFGVQAERRVGCSQNWKVGGRISIPYKIIEIEQNNTGTKFVEDLSDVIFEQSINTNTNAETIFLIDYAYRLDFLSCLVRPRMPGAAALSQQLPIVDLSPNTAGPTQMASISVGISPAALAADPNTGAGVLLIKRDDSSVPMPQFIANPANTAPVMQGKQYAQVTGPLAADGSGVNNGVYHFNDASVDYRNNLGTNRDAQSTLWVVPHVTDNGSTWVDGGTQVQNAVKSIIDNLLASGDRSPLAFFCENGINLLGHERVNGIGDIRTEFYGGWDACDAFAYLIFGILIPTGRPMTNSNLVYFQTPGNNRHGEISFGATGGWRPYNWFAFQLWGTVHHACKHNEKKAAAFKGSTVINIGPEVDARVAWTYGIFRADFTFFHPCNEDLGVVFGYELWGKTKDHVKFCQTTAVDFFGNVASLDACLLEKNTNSMTQKLRGELFFRRYFFEIFAGGSQVLAGRHAMQESEVHLGFAFYF